MMTITAGKFLKSTGSLDGSIFENSTILIAEVNSQGAIGFMINRPLGRFLHELVEFKDSPIIPLYEGGPVASDHIFLLHRCSDLIRESRPIAGDLFWGGKMEDAVTGINSGRIHPGNMKILVGYCGWDAGELESEIAESSWNFITEYEEGIFSKP